MYIIIIIITEQTYIYTKVLFVLFKPLDDVYFFLFVVVVLYSKIIR